MSTKRRLVDDSSKMLNDTVLNECSAFMSLSYLDIISVMVSLLL